MRQGWSLDIALSEITNDLDEVIIVAYGKVKKSDFTGSAIQLSAKDLGKRPIANVLEAFQGAGPGIQTAAPSGAPGSSPTIRIRGIGSYSAGNDALIVVGGIPFDGGTANINPDDVENITVLKDAATIAIYGSRGANSVVIVTTKREKKVKASLMLKFNLVIIKIVCRTIIPFLPGSIMS
ncbi:TonB-dependent receptor plug domain-containing protein [Sphingobacterium sp.]|uniref:TonB-dependent receptor plug domain-containing protein n=1 Tax=Sphingobacterium sp. TaxID=341027 RepID=UPI0031D5B1AA